VGGLGLRGQRAVAGFVARLVKYAHLAPEYIAGFANNAKPWSQKAAMGVA